MTAQRHRNASTWYRLLGELRTAAAAAGAAGMEDERTEDWGTGGLGGWSIGVLELWSARHSTAPLPHKSTVSLCRTPAAYSAPSSRRVNESCQSPVSRFRSRVSTSFKRPFSNL